jgi:hypothetical protein
MTENERTMMLAETTVDIIAMLEERIGPSDDELAVLSSVISYILCNHLSNEEHAQNAFNAISHNVNQIMQSADRTGNTFWVSGPGH